MIYKQCIEVLIIMYLQINCKSTKHRSTKKNFMQKGKYIFILATTLYHEMVLRAGNINTHLPDPLSCNPLGLSPLMEKVESWRFLCPLLEGVLSWGSGACEATTVGS
jgi:hypothetical protein